MRPNSGKRQFQVSLETTDYAQAVAKAREILNQPLLNTTEGFKPDLDDFADEQVKAGIWTKKSRKNEKKGNGAAMAKAG